MKISDPPHSENELSKESNHSPQPCVYFGRRSGQSVMVGTTCEPVPDEADELVTVFRIGQYIVGALDDIGRLGGEGGRLPFRVGSGATPPSLDRASRPGNADS